MRTQLFDLGLELDYARELLKQARIDLADAAHGHPPAADERLEHLRDTVRERQDYVRRVLRDYATAKGSPLA